MMERSPPYWMDELSGQLRPAVEAYLDGGTLCTRHIAVLRLYLTQWIESPLWDRHPFLDAAHLSDLRRRAAGLKTHDDLDQWIVEAVEYGFDPL